MYKLGEIIQLSKKLISVESIPANTKALDAILGLALSNLGEFTIEKFDDNGTKSALIYNTPKRPKKFKVILNGHLDVIPREKGKNNPKIIGDKLYGAGSMDMKSSIACLILVFKEVAKKVDYPLALQLVTDEQSGSLHGTKHQIERGVRANFAIAGEATNFGIVNKSKGVVWMKVTAKGKTTHSAYPWQGNNSIWLMYRFLNNLKEIYPNPKNDVWETTINVSHIETKNSAFNKVPDICQTWLDIRYIPDDANTIVQNIQKLLPKKFSLETVYKEPPLLVNENNAYVKSLQRIASSALNHKIEFKNAHGTSDATYFTSKGSIAVEFGPRGKAGDIDDEYIEISSLDKYYQILTQYLLSLNRRM